MSRADAGRGQPGFALPLAIIVLVALSLAAALLMDGAVASFREAGADLQLARMNALAESALVAGLDARLDTAALAVSPGTVLRTSRTQVPDSVSNTIQMLASHNVRVVVSVRSVAPAIRLSIGRVVYARLEPVPDTGGELRIAVIRPAWWVPIP